MRDHRPLRPWPARAIAWPAILILTLAALGAAGLSADGTAVRIGTLPIADSVALHVAQRQGYFRARGLEVELIPFQSAMEKDAAALAGSIDGHFCEIGSVIVQRSLGLPFQVVAASSHTDKARRNFGLVTRPGSQAKTLDDLRGASLAIARFYIVDFLTDAFLLSRNLPLDFFDRRDIKKIPVRYQMLVSGQIEAALFPEPLLSMAEREGGTVVMDDTGLDMPLAVIALRTTLGAEAIEATREALAQAVAWINQNPQPARDLMAELRLIPPALGRDIVLPEFNPRLIPWALPSEDLFDSYVDWLARSQALAPRGSPTGGGLRAAPAYADAVFQAPPPEDR
ncbi:MAG: ABC transporter substrate-binding protein [Deltaproteobacteria bacterium]|jgi:NitT/TauT family transport system substrate-binding protein|nr:ABC transporter substrate-binding protein [Deltaproteobacteria bacterium]